MSAVTTNSQLLTVNEAAGVLRVHPVTLRKWIAKGRVTAVQLGGPGNAVRIDSAELERFIYGWGGDAA